MKRLWIAVGNPLRGDDGVAHRAVELAEPGPDTHVCHVIQLTPELAPVIAGYREVLFLDASVGAAAPSRSHWSHHMTPDALVALARRLYGFEGSSRVHSLAAEQFEQPFQLSDQAEDSARRFAEVSLRSA